MLRLSIDERELEEAVSKSLDYYYNGSSEGMATRELEEELGLSRYDAMVAARIGMRVYNDHVQKFL